MVIKTFVRPALTFIPRITVNSFSMILRIFFVAEASGLLIVQNLLHIINITRKNAIQLIANIELLEGSKIENRLIIIVCS